MEPSLHFVTLGVRDMAAARRFYVDGLGWTPTFEVPGDVIFIQIGPGLLLSLFGADDLEADVRGSRPDAGATPAVPPAVPVTLSQVVDTEAEVVAVMRAAEAAGATVLKTPRRADFGGFHGYFADPNGFRWEIATNPGWSVADDGTVSIGPIGG
jgi:uncharacterized protein